LRNEKGRKGARISNGEMRHNNTWHVFGGEDGLSFEVVINYLDCN